MDGTGAPVDDAVLEGTANRARTHSLVETVRTEQTESTVSMVVLELDGDRYPDRVQAASVEIQWYTNGDYNFHYVETHAAADRSTTADGVWQCRWDRHPNPHTTRSHFHPPPAADSESAVSDQPTERHPAAMFTRTLANVRERIDDLWELK